MSDLQEFNCIFCKETFPNKEELQDHFRKHGDPNFDKNKKNRFRNPNEHVVDDNTKVEPELIGCDVCTEVFPTISKAITHKHKVHPEHDAKYFCPWCGKLFTMKHLYNKHLLSNHEDVERDDNATCFRCDACNVDFYVPSAMLNHNRFFHRQENELICIGQSNKIKIINQEMLQLYYCTFCGEEYNNKINIQKHVEEEHSDENQSPDDVLRCPLCDAIFYHLDAFELHLTFHSSEDMYSDKKEMAEHDLTEFSLETVPPIMEKVTDIGESENTGNLTDTTALSNFLQLAMDEGSVDHDSSNSDVNSQKKSKKHKKHKKSKKASITLDEFLNMNKDVFGEGIDFQGIEEVPTQAVAKRLKKNPQPSLKAQGKTEAKANIAKLKMQGITVKVNPVQNLNTPKIGSKLSIANSALKPTNNAPKINTSNISKPSQLNSEQVLSKLLNSSNNQIKIVKKNSQEDTVSSEADCLTEKEANVSDSETFDHNTETEHETVHKEFSNEGITAMNKNIPDKIENSDLDNHDEDNTSANNETYKAEEKSNVNNSEICVKKKEVTNTILKSMGENITIKSGNVNSFASDKNSEIYDAKTKSINHTDNKQIENDTEEYNKNGCDENIINSKNSSFNVLKHLSHLTVKPTSKFGISNQATNKDTSVSQKDSDDYEDLESQIKPNSIIKKDFKLNIKNQKHSEPSQDILKTKLTSHKGIYKNMPIKPSKNTVDDNFSDNESGIDELDDLNTTNVNNSQIIEQLKTSNINITRSLPKLLKHSHEDEMASVFTKVNSDILKNLDNITAKPVSIIKPKIDQVVMRSMQANNNVKLNLKQSPNRQNENKAEEIFNIDDSDSDELSNAIPNKNTDNNIHDTKTDQLHVPKGMDSLKNIGKHITIKQTGNNSPVGTMLKNSVTVQNNKNIIADNAADSNFNKPRNITTPNNKSSNRFINKKSDDAIKHVLKNLGQNVTIKGNSTISSKKLDNELNDDEMDVESENESDSGRVKITELDEDYTEEDLSKALVVRKNPLVQSPPDSDNDEWYDDSEQFSDFEGEEMTDASKGQTNNPSVNKAMDLNILKGIGRNITIKSVNKNNKDQSIETDEPVKCNYMHVQQKSMKKKESAPTHNKQSNQNLGRLPKPTVNTQNIATSNETSTNKVSVKTIQTNTVIQEITTTVTKTVRTVNQTVQQGQNMSKVVCSPNVRPLKIAPSVRGINPHITRNPRPVAVRQPSPAIGTKIRTTTPMRPTTCNTVRPSNQIVPMRPGISLGTARMRMPSTNQSANKNVPSSSNQPRFASGRTLKISPKLLNASAKRPINEPPGHFSCFKKPKESLCPDDSFEDAQMEGTETKSSHTSTAHFSSTTVKGNKVVTQMKSETSHQQLTKLTNVSGLNVVESSQIQQTSQIERSDLSSAPKRTTLEAIEKLQKQGLLVKKPKIDFPDSDHSDQEGDDYYDDD